MKEALEIAWQRGGFTIFALVGAGEEWLTELSTAELKELFALRKEAVAR